MNSFFQLALILNLTLGLFAALSDFKITCKDESGKPVDWFSAYKLPRRSDSTDANIKTGGGYVYLTEKFQNWTLSGQSFDKSSSIIGKTLESFYSSNFADSSKLGFLLYNDQFEEQDLGKYDYDLFRV
jgi:deoxyribonuclease-2